MAFKNSQQFPFPSTSYSTALACPQYQLCFVLLCYFAVATVQQICKTVGDLAACTSIDPCKSFVWDSAHRDAHTHATKGSP